MMFKVITYIAAIALVAFSGAVSTYGLTNFAPGCEWVIFAMGVLFEVGKLIALGLVVRLSWRYFPLRVSLLVVAIVLMALNVVGVSGFLSKHFEQELTKTEAANHTAGASAQVDVDLAERSLASAEKALTEANVQLVAARNNKARQAAANANIVTKTKVRDDAATALRNAKRAAVKVEGVKIESAGEVAAIMVLAERTHMSVRETASWVFLGVACIPELLAFLLMLAVELHHHPVPAAPAVEAPAVEETPVPVEETEEKVVPIRSKSSRARAAKKGWETRRRNMAKASGPKLVVRS